MKKSMLISIGFVFLSLSLIQCTSVDEKHINIVKDGVFTDYQTVKVGAILENKSGVKSSEWLFNESDQGEKSVVYRGHINTDSYLLIKKMWEVYATIEFVFFAESENFDIKSSKISLERVNLNDSDLFSLTEAKDDKVLVGAKGNISKILQIIQGNDDTFSGFNLSVFESEHIARGVNQAINDLSLSKLEMLPLKGMREEEKKRVSFIGPMGRLFAAHEEMIWEKKVISSETRLVTIDSEKEEDFYNMARYLDEFGLSQISEDWRREKLIKLFTNSLSSLKDPDYYSLSKNYDWGFRGKLGDDLIKLYSSLAKEEFKSKEELFQRVEEVFGEEMAAKYHADILGKIDEPYIVSDEERNIRSKFLELLEKNK